jgi:hypothetical protein
MRVVDWRNATKRPAAARLMNAVDAHSTNV